MNSARLDPSLLIFLDMSEERRSGLADEGRLVVESDGESVALLVSVTCRGELPEVEGVEKIGQLGDVATARVRAAGLERLSEQPEVVWIAPVRRGNLLVDRSRGRVGLTIVDGQSIRAGSTRWDGSGVFVGIVDGGFDLRHPSLRQFPGGPTRVEFYWDRRVTPRAGVDTPGPAGVGAVYDRAAIDQFLLGPAPGGAPVLHPEAIDRFGHGTHVSGIAAGRGGPHEGVAPGARLILVGWDGQVDRLAEIADWVFARAGATPCTINLSLGHNTGPHDGTSEVETGLDDLLRDRTQAAQPSRAARFLAIAAGNERLEAHSVNVRALPTDPPGIPATERMVTQLVWQVGADDRDTNEVSLWCPGLDQIRVRLVCPPGGLSRNVTHWVRPDPAGCREEASPGGFAPTAAGPSPTKTFEFPNAAGGAIRHRAVISMAANPRNGDRMIQIRLESVGGPISAGLWLLEIDGANELPAKGRVHAYLSETVGTAVGDTVLISPHHTIRELRIEPGAVTELLTFVPLRATHDCRVQFDYPAHQRLEVQVERDPEVAQWIGHGPVAIADASLVAPGAATPAGLPITFPIAGTIVVNHLTRGDRNRIAVQIPNGPVHGFTRLRLRLAAGSVGPVEASARLIQDNTVPNEFATFEVTAGETIETVVYPDRFVPAVSTLPIGFIDLTTAALRVEAPSGFPLEVRVRFPSVDSRGTRGTWRVTPWVGPGHAQTATPDSLPAVAAAAGVAPAFVDGDAEVVLDYPNPAAGAPAVVRVELFDHVGSLRPGLWRLEYRARGATTARPVRTSLVRDHFIDRDEILAQDPPSLVTRAMHLDEVLPERAAATFRVPEETADQVDVEVLYGSPLSPSIRLHPPAPEAMPFLVAPGNRLTNLGAVAPVNGASGVTWSLTNGSTVTIDHSGVDVVPGIRRILVTLRAPGNSLLVAGNWRVELTQSAPDRRATRLDLRIFSSGPLASFASTRAATGDDQLGSLSIPGTAREPLTVGNAIGEFEPVVLPNLTSSAGPVREATQRLVAATERPWTHFPKPEVMAPGTAVAAACSADAINATPLGNGLHWPAFALPDGRDRAMRANWPLLAGNGITRVENASSAPAPGAAAPETRWPFVLPAGVGTEVDLELRHPVAHDFRIRVEQPAGAPAARITNAVDAAGNEIAVAGRAVGSTAPQHPDGRGRDFRMGDGSRVVIRRDGAGRVRIRVLPPLVQNVTWSIDPLAAGEWQVVLSHSLQLPGPVPVTLEARPPIDPRGWPKFRAGVSARISGTIPAAVGGSAGSDTIPVEMPPRMVAETIVRLTYPTAASGGPPAGQVDVLVQNPAETNITRLVTETNSRLAITLPNRTTIAGIGVGARSEFTFPSGDLLGIEHHPGSVVFTFTRGGSAEHRIAPGVWRILVRNQHGAVLPVTVELDPLTYDLCYFRLPVDAVVPFRFARAEFLTAGSAEQWPLRVSRGRHDPLEIECIYDARDTLEIQLQDPGGDRSESVGHADSVAAPGSHGATLPSTGTTASGVGFRAAGRYRAFLRHDTHPTAPAGSPRHRVALRLEPDGDDPIPPGDWIVHLRPTAIVSHGMVEAWIREMLFERRSGTSMASPLVTGLGALLLQQDVTQTHEQIKRRILAATTPVVAIDGGTPQLPNQWHPVAGFGLVDAARALLGHSGGALANRPAPPASVARTTGCPVACEDNCLLQVERDPGGAVVGLRPAPRAPYSRSPETPGGPAVLECARLASHLDNLRSPAFTTATNLRGLTTLRVASPLIRDREHRGGLEHFRAIEWPEAYRRLADRFVEAWSKTGPVLVLEGRPDAGLVRELLFNRFVHHMHRLLGANTRVTTCSFTTKRSDVLPSQVPFGSATRGPSTAGLREFFRGVAAEAHGRCDLSQARNVVVWGANLPAQARGTWRAITAARTLRGDAPQVFVIDPGLPDLPEFVRRIPILPGADRHLALGLMLAIVGDPAAALPSDPRFDDPARGRRRFLDLPGTGLSDFLGHVRSAAAGYVTTTGTRVVPGAALLDLCVGRNTAALTRDRFRAGFEALREACLDGPTAFLLGSGPGRHVAGEENVQYLAALVYLSGNVGTAGGGLSFSEDHHARMNPASFASSRDTLRPQDNHNELGPPEQQERLNIASLGADAADNTKCAIWFDVDPLTHSPDPTAVRSLLERTGVNVQIGATIDDASRFADIILPLGDTLISYDLQFGGRSGYINLSQVVAPRDESGPRPLARILHELLGALHAELLDEFASDLRPVIDEPRYLAGALVLPATASQDHRDLFADAQRIPQLLQGHLPQAEIQAIHGRLRDWYTGLQTDHDRLQVDWILEVLKDRYPAREMLLLLYELLERGTALDPARFANAAFTLGPDGGVPFERPLVTGTTAVDLKGAGGFAAERPAYANAVQAIDAGGDGRARYPMRLVIAESTEFASTAIPLTEQVLIGAVRPPIATLNPASASVVAAFAPTPLVDGGMVALVGNLATMPARTFEAVIARARVRFDHQMALETIRMVPGWDGLDRGGQRLVRAVHSEEGEGTALFDNLVRLAPADYSPGGNAPDRGTPLPKR